MTTTLTIIRSRPGDFVAHRGGCRDIARSHRAQGPDDRPSDYSGETLLDAIVAADTEMAAWFGQEVYLTDPPENPWNVRSVEWAPCFAKLVEGEGIVFDIFGRPSIPAAAEAGVQQDAQHAEIVKRIRHSADTDLANGARELADKGYALADAVERESPAEPQEQQDRAYEAYLNDYSLFRVEVDHVHVVRTVNNLFDVWFAVMPLPDRRWQIAVKPDARRVLENAVALANAFLGG